MIFANCDIYENSDGEIGVLTRTEDNSSFTFLVNEDDPNDVSINFDKRLIEFFLSESGPHHTYREWDELMKSCNYPSIFMKDFNLVKGQDDLYYDKAMEHYDDEVFGFEVTFVPKGKLLRIAYEPVYGSYGSYEGKKQIIEILDVNDFIET